VPGAARQKAVTFTSLEDWTNRNEPGIKYFSGTAVYSKTFDITSQILQSQFSLLLDLDIVKHIASIKLNNKNLGILWTAPWIIKIPSAV